ncbi:M23 family metallopeptidase [Actinomycetospora sp.]|uniref:M23 family metallopeptidase n=1 Tax=Actinomycetospora sp. TaxID=1872135 RepID=UPI002F414482
MPAGGPGLFGGGPRFADGPRRPVAAPDRGRAPRPVPDGRTANFTGGSGRAPALPARAPADLRPGAPAAGPAGDPRGPGRGNGPLTGRLAVAAVAVGALATAGHSLAAGLDAPTGETRADLALSAAGTAASPGVATAGSGALDAATTGVMAVSPAADRADAPHAASLAKARKVADAAAAREAAAKAPKFVKPADGRFTSGFGARWGTAHKGVDIANAIGTPIVAAAGGTIVDSGPASGFGMWVRVQLDDGTINVYGHINRSYVKKGQKVKTGQEIAEIGNRGQSTGPHLHFEVWTPGGTKINPLPWLAERGISLGTQAD